MSNINIDLSKINGKMKIMHSVNNVPYGDAVRQTNAISNYKYFADAKIPYCRNHDASGFEGYCGEHIVDVHRIFKNFDNDVNDPNSYDFEYTDEYVKSAYSVGSKIFYRLGAMIEHKKKVGTIPPKDYLKWAKICEHIIRHYTEGWANGYKYDMEYWEIWNEPECRNADGTNPCWQGTQEEFRKFFITVFKHLKSNFPHLKIGGPALCGTWRDAYNHEFFDALKENDIILDFYSFHGYHNNPHKYYDDGEHAYNLLCEYNLENHTELILNEWNYVRSWTGDGYVHSIKSIKSLKGSSYITGTMVEGQRSKLNHMMYYDARPCTWNGMFDTTFLTPLKGYYPFKMYSDLYELGYEVDSKSDDENVFVISAKNECECGIMFTYFSDDDFSEKSINLNLNISNMDKSKTKTIEYYLLDENHDMSLIRRDTTSAESLCTSFNFTLYSTIYVKIH